MASPETQFLVAAGDPAEGRLIRAALEKIGLLQVTVVNDGDTALKLIESGLPYFIIAAWELPGLGGLRLAKEARRRPGASAEAVVLIVNAQHESELILAKEIKVNGFMIRPLSLKQISSLVLEIMNRRPESDWPRAMEESGDQLAEEGDQEQALARYQQAVSAGRRRLAGLETEIGLVFLKKGRKHEAVGHLEKAVQADPKMARAQAGLGRAYLEAGQPDKAGEALEKAAVLDPHNENIRADLADSLLEAGQLERAETLFHELLGRRPQDLHILNRMGIALRKQKKYDQALAHYHKALTINDRDENLYFNLGRCYYELGDFDQAKAAVNRALQLNPKDEEARTFLERLSSQLKKESG